jgi:hypothetical protein
VTPPDFGIDIWKPQFTREVIGSVHNGGGYSLVVKFNDIHQLINQTTVMSFEIIQLFLTATSREHDRLLRSRLVVLCGAYVVLIVLKYKTLYIFNLYFFVGNSSFGNVRILIL